MNICYVCNEYPPKPHGGIGTYVKAMAEALVKEGHNVVIVGIGEKDDAKMDNEVMVVELSLPKVPRLFQAWLGRYKLYACLKRLAKTKMIDIVEVPDYQGWLPFRFGFCPVIVRLHLSETVIGEHNRQHISHQISRYEDRTLRKGRTWVGVSKWAYEKTVEVFGKEPESHEVIYSPVTLEEPGSGVSYENYILYAGTVSQRKGAITLAHSAVRILTSHPELSLVYAGRAEPEEIVEEIKAIIGEELCRRVHFTGRLPRAEIMNLMTRARVFTFPSSLETFGLVIAEAMLCGVPVVCCDTGPCPEFVENGRTGELVPVDDNELLAAAVERILTDKKYGKKLAINASKYISKEFSLDRAVKENLELYESIVSSILYKDLMQSFFKILCMKDNTWNR